MNIRPHKQEWAWGEANDPTWLSRKHVRTSCPDGRPGCLVAHYRAETDEEYIDRTGKLPPGVLMGDPSDV